MLRYELCKLFARPSGKAALLLLAVLVAVSTFFACHVRYTDEEGQTQYGLSAVRQLRADQKAWAGPLDEAQLRRAIQANLDVRTSPDAQSEDVVRQDMAFHRQQAFEAIRDLLNSAYSEDFQAFDYFTADTLTPEDAPDFYANRVRLLQQWLEQTQALNQETYRAMEEILSEMKEEHKRDGRQRDEFTRKLSAIGSTFQKDTQEAISSLRRWVPFIIMSSAAAAVPVCILMWQTLT